MCLLCGQFGAPRLAHRIVQLGWVGSDQPTLLHCCCVCRQITCNGPTCRIPIMLTVAGAVAAAYWFKRQAELPKRKLPEPWPEVRHMHHSSGPFLSLSLSLLVRRLDLACRCTCDPQLNRRHNRTQLVVQTEPRRGQLPPSHTTPHARPHCRGALCRSRALRWTLRRTKRRWRAPGRRSACSGPSATCAPTNPPGGYGWCGRVTVALRVHKQLCRDGDARTENV